MPSPEHREKWIEFETLMNFRSNVGMIIQVTNNVVWAITGKGRATLSKNYLESGDCNCDADLGLLILPYIDWALIVLNGLRILLIIVSAWRPGICKYYLAFEMIYFAIRETAIIDYGQVRQGSTNNMLAIKFILTSYPGWSSLIVAGMGMTYNNVFLKFIYKISEPIFVPYFFNLAWMMLACFYGLVGFGWLGMLFVQAELPRISHENLLHNFKEGVFIVDEDTSHLQFTNRAASKIIKGLETTCNLELLQNSNDKKASSNISVNLDQGSFQKVDEKQIRLGNTSQLDQMLLATESF